MPLFAILTACICSCSEGEGERNVEYKSEDILGRWELQEAWRNQKKTELLYGTYFVFDASGTMRTNFNPTTQERTYPYEFDETKILQKGDQKITYNIEELRDSSLTLSMVINNFLFRLRLKKTPVSESTQPSPSESGM